MTETAEVKPLTREIIQSWSKEQMIKEMADPARRAEIEQAWSAPSAEEIAAKASEEAELAEENRLIEEAKQAVIDEQRQAAETEAARVAAEEAEKARLAEAAKPPEPPKKIVVEYQATDDVTGEPIGRKTHIEGYTWEEVSEKQKAAHVNAVRYAERIKRQRSKPAEPEVAPPLTDEERIAQAEKLRSEDPKEVIAASARIAQDSEARARAAEARALGQKIALDFMRRHILDYNPCAANSQILSNYIKDNDLDWTVDNLEIAFEETASQLAPVPAPAAPAPAPRPVVTEIAPAVDNTPAPAKPIEAPAPAPVEPAAPPAAAPNAPAPARKAPDGGLIPGESVSGSRPSGTPRPAGLTKKDIKDMSKEEFKRRLTHEKGFREKVDALWAKK